MRTCFFILFFSRLFFPPQFLILLNAVTGRGYLTFMACDWYLLLLIFSLIFIVQNVMNSLFLVWFVAGGAPSSLRIAFVFFFPRVWKIRGIFTMSFFTFFSFFSRHAAFWLAGNSNKKGNDGNACHKSLEISRIYNCFWQKHVGLNLSLFRGGGTKELLKPLEPQGKRPGPKCERTNKLQSFELLFFFFF